MAVNAQLAITQLQEKILQEWDRLNILIVDDSQSLQERLLGMLGGVTGLENIGQAYSVAEARRVISEQQPAIVILDIQLGDGSGINLLRETKQKYPAIRFIVFTNQCEAQYRQRCTDLGADFFLCKSTGAKSLVATSTDLAADVGH
jgi:Response regulator containing a CheY-like receiver domain and an HTH DNA-binding domain